MRKKGIYLVHGAGVANDDMGFLLPAWKGVGKTALGLALVERGFSFLGDDRVWVSHTGHIIGNQRYVVIQDSNAKYLPEFTSVIDKIKRQAAHFCKSMPIVSTSRFYKLVCRIIQVRARYYKIHELYPHCDTPPRARLNRVIYMQTSNEAADIALKKMDANNLQQKIANINLYEWNLDFMKLGVAHDILFEGKSLWREEIHRFSLHEKDAFLEIFSKIECYELQLPAGLLSWRPVTELVSNQ